MEKSASTKKKNRKESVKKENVKYEIIKMFLNFAVRVVIWVFVMYIFVGPCRETFIDFLTAVSVSKDFSTLNYILIMLPIVVLFEATMELFRKVIIDRK